MMTWKQPDGDRMILALDRKNHLLIEDTKVGISGENGQHEQAAVQKKQGNDEVFFPGSGKDKNAIEESCAKDLVVGIKAIAGLLQLRVGQVDVDKIERGHECCKDEDKGELPQEMYPVTTG